MADNSSWYRNKFATQRQPAQPMVPQYVPQQQYVVQPGQAPVPVQYVQPQALQQPQQAPQEIKPANLSQGLALAQQGALHQQGGDMVRRGISESGARIVDSNAHCPQCGSGNYFQFQTSKRMPPTAPRCFECGWNDGEFVQGLESSWVGK